MESRKWKMEKTRNKCTKGSNFLVLTKRLKKFRCDKLSTPQWLKERSAMYNVTKDTYHKSFFSLAWHSSSASRRVIQTCEETPLNYHCWFFILLPKLLQSLQMWPSFPSLHLSSPSMRFLDTLWDYKAFEQPSPHLKKISLSKCIWGAVNISCGDKERSQCPCKVDVIWSIHVLARYLSYVKWGWKKHTSQW